MRKRNTRKEEDREILQGIIGILKVKNKDSFDYKKEYRKLLEKKYGVSKKRNVKKWNNMLSMPTDEVDLPENLDVDKEYGRLLDEKYKRKRD